MKITQIEYYPRSGHGMFVLSDGRSITIKLSERNRDSRVEKTTYRPNSPVLKIQTTQADNLVFELPAPADLDPFRTRPVVYLDQNIWSRVATALHRPERLKADEVDDALWIADLARDWKVILPFSAGTLTETTQWNDDTRRYHLGATICQLSRGWQMLDPEILRVAEMGRALSLFYGDMEDRVPQAWHLEANAVFSGMIDSQSEDFGGRLTPDQAKVFEAVVAIGATVDMLLDIVPVERHQSDRWAKRWAGISDHLRTTPASPRIAERSARFLLLHDAGGELSRAAVELGITPDTLGKWIDSSALDDVRNMPAFGLFSEVMLLKIFNAQAKWKQNDMVDTFYMVQAAGYADAVVGERGFSSLTRNAQKRLNRTENCFSSLKSLRQSGLLDGLSSRPPTSEESKILSQSEL